MKTDVEDQNDSNKSDPSLPPDRHVIFGFIPFVIFMINPALIWLGTFGIMSIAMGFGDYINVFNALTQMPNGALTYLNGFHSYWYKED